MARDFELNDWEGYAIAYDTLNELGPYVQTIEDVVAALIGAEYPLLDAGCGTGNLIQRLIASGEEQITGIDITSAMLERAKKKCPGINFQVANLDQRIAFQDGFFRTVTCVNALYAVADPGQTLREFTRLLQPEGLLVVVTPKRGYENGLTLKAHRKSERPDSYWLNAHATPEREELLLREALSDPVLVEKMLQVARFNREIAKERTFHFFTSEELSLLVRECGFGNVQIRETYAGQNLLLTAKRMS